MTGTFSLATIPFACRSAWPSSSPLRDRQVPWGSLAVCLWSALLMNGLWRLVTLDRQLRFRLVLAALLVFELSLHMVYGEETFTYV